MDADDEQSERVHSAEATPETGDTQQSSTVIHRHYHYHHHYYHNSPPPRHHHHHHHQRSTPSHRVSPRRSHGSPSRQTLPSRWASDSSERSESHRRVDEWNRRSRPGHSASPGYEEVGTSAPSRLATESQRLGAENRPREEANTTEAGEIGEVDEVDPTGATNAIDIIPDAATSPSLPVITVRCRRDGTWDYPTSGRTSRSLSREIARIRLERSDSSSVSPDRSLQRSAGRLQRSRLAFIRRPFGSLSSPAEHLQNAIQGERTEANVRKLFLAAILLIREQEHSVSPRRGWQLVTEKLIRTGVYTSAEEAHTAWTDAFGETAATVLEDLFLMPRQGAYRTVTDLLADN